MMTKDEVIIEYIKKCVPNLKQLSLEYNPRYQGLIITIHWFEGEDHFYAASLLSDGTTPTLFEYMPSHLRTPFLPSAEAPRLTDYGKQYLSTTVEQLLAQKQRN